MILLALVDGTPKVLNLKEMLEAYIAHQKSVVTRRTQYDLNKAQEREHIIAGMVKAHEVLFLGLVRGHAHSSAALSAVFVDGQYRRSGRDAQEVQGQERRHG